MNTTAVLNIENLTVSYSNNKALYNVSCTIPSKQIIGIIGPNGGGKSTFIKAIMGLLPIQQGRIEVLGNSIKKSYKHIAYVPQKNTFDLSFPILVEDVVIMGRYSHMPWWRLNKSKHMEKVYDSLRKVGLYELRKRQIGELSGGQLQRVLIARALAQEAELLLLDEPFAGIDIASENIIMDLLKELKDLGKTIFLVHHDLSKVDKYFDSLILLNQKLIAYGPKETVFHIDHLKEAYSGSGSLTLDQNQLLVVN